MKKDPRQLKRTNIYLTSRQHAALEKESKRLGITTSELIRRALDRFVATIPAVSKRLQETGRAHGKKKA